MAKKSVASKKTTKRKKSTTKAAANKRSPFHILVANDDGINSPGIRALAQALRSVGTVTVVAPEREQSTMGHALTLHKPVRLFEMGNENGVDRWALSGTPADCVYMGIRHVLKRKPDLIVSGINKGVNLGNDLYFSGTVAAAREGAVLNIPAMACSLDYRYGPGEETTKHFEAAAEYCAQLAKEILKNGLPDNCLLNVNFPALAFEQIKGASVSRQGLLKYTDTITERKDFRGKPYFWLGGKLVGFSQIEGSDAAMVDQGYISITPVRIDSTQYEFMESLRSWDIDPHASSTKKKSARKSAVRKARK